MILSVAADNMGRPDEARAVAGLLDAAAVAPSGLILEGEAGIGKTTVVNDAVRRAEDLGFRVLSAHGAPGEVTYAFAAVADLLSNLSTADLAALPRLQRVALERVMLWGTEGPPTDERTVAAALLAIIKQLGADTPILVAIDDAQWLDPSSRTAIGYVARRATGRIAFLAANRIDDPIADALAWLQLAQPAALARIEIGPMTVDRLGEILSSRLDYQLSYPLLTRIHQLSGGNPFYALELGRTGKFRAGHEPPHLPVTLAELTRRRLAPCDTDTRTMLLVLACAGECTTSVLIDALKVSHDSAMQTLAGAEAAGLVSMAHGTVRFTHPLLTAAAYHQATPADRREIHRRLADAVDNVELRGRHLALAATSADTATLKALDAAAAIAAARGAPDAAAELLESATRLGDSDPIRRFRCAEMHFRAGAMDKARAHLSELLGSIGPGLLRAAALTLRGAVCAYGEDLRLAVQSLTDAIGESGGNTALRLRARLLLTPTTGVLGHLDDCLEQARNAVQDAEALGIPGQLSQALTMRVFVDFMFGQGLDSEVLNYALAIEEPDATTHVTFRASAVRAVIDAWCGDLESARRKLLALHLQCIERGVEPEIPWVEEHLAMVDLWLGRYDDVEITHQALRRRADQLDKRQQLVISTSYQAALAARLGREEEARAAAATAIKEAQAGGYGFLLMRPTAALGFLEVSLGNYAAAIQTLQPLLTTFGTRYGTEITMAEYFPDAIEALIGLGRASEAEPLIAALEANGAECARAWMIATGARGRALLLTSDGDMAAAETVLGHAMNAHHELPMPFERARTLLLLGQVHRRRRRSAEATAALTEAADTFRRLGAALWATRAERELQRITARSGAALTDTQLRVARYAADGLSNKEIATAMFLSPKTVEMHLSGVYRKLGIRSRNQLAARLQ